MSLHFWFDNRPPDPTLGAPWTFNPWIHLGPHVAICWEWD